MYGFFLLLFLTSVRSVLTWTASEQSMIGTRGVNVDIIQPIILVMLQKCKSNCKVYYTSVRSVLTWTASEQSMIGTRAVNVDIIRNVTYKYKHC